MQMHPIVFSYYACEDTLYNVDVLCNFVQEYIYIILKALPLWCCQFWPRGAQWHWRYWLQLVPLITTFLNQCMLIAHWIIWNIWVKIPVFPLLLIFSWTRHGPVYTTDLIESIYDAGRHNIPKSNMPEWQLFKHIVYIVGMPVTISMVNCTRQWVLNGVWNLSHLQCRYPNIHNALTICKDIFSIDELLD